MEGLSTGLKLASWKGKRLIIVHIGSANGSLTGDLLTIRANQIE